AASVAIAWPPPTIRGSTNGRRVSAISRIKVTDGAWERAPTRFPICTLRLPSICLELQQPAEIDIAGEPRHRHSTRRRRRADVPLAASHIIDPGRRATAWTVT